MVDEDCGMGGDLFQLLLDMKVDLVITAHDHNYQRTHQLVKAASCPRLPLNFFDQNCVSDAGGTREYARGLGTIQVTVGTGGAELSDINPRDAEAQYFVVPSGEETGVVHGLSKFTVSESAIDVEFLANIREDSVDGFSIREFGIVDPFEPGMR
jgi:hypothetical protein